ncbi:hypothetical protein R3P38DRAFT_3246901 [Favolaschia claudopus]|uniref:Uncharacterized protein n=1 Tax=Favolaschia claudopus TaxID=2862362 RepID=A0AAV9YYM5_9AGAR
MTLSLLHHRPVYTADDGASHHPVRAYGILSAQLPSRLPTTSPAHAILASVASNYRTLGPRPAPPTPPLFALPAPTCTY